jgi:hypothetical protein
VKFTSGSDMLRAMALAGIGFLTVGIACAQTESTKSDSAALTLGVFMEFDADPGAPSLAAMKREVDALLKPAGIHVNWRLARENKGTETYARLVVLKFTGACRADWALQSRDESESVAVGDTMVEKGHVLPYSEVRCDAVRRALTYLAPATSKEQRQEALGLAMGRVVAHELYHVLAQTTSHAQHGLAKASQPLRELISRQTMAFGEQDSEAIRKGFDSPIN